MDCGTSAERRTTAGPAGSCHRGRARDQSWGEEAPRPPQCHHLPTSAGQTSALGAVKLPSPLRHTAARRARGAAALAALRWFQRAKNECFHHPRQRACAGIKHRSLSSHKYKGQAPRHAADNTHRSVQSPGRNQHAKQTLLRSKHAL